MYVCTAPVRKKSYTDYCVVKNRSINQSVRVVHWVIFIIESGTISACYYYWVECLHLVQLERHAASTAVTTEDPDWWHQMIIFKYPLNKSVELSDSCYISVIAIMVDNRDNDSIQSYYCDILDCPCFVKTWVTEASMIVVKLRKLQKSSWACLSLRIKDWCKQ